MFTGIVQGLGKVAELTSLAGEFRLAVRPEFDWDGPLVLGESVSVSGACLTVSGLEREAFVAHVSAETVARTTLKTLRPGHRVNLERALRLSDRLGGHLVSGHVDGVGRILSLRRRDDSLVLTVGLEPELMPFIIEKGSVAVDGVSLTVNVVEAGSFTANLIPHTLQVTTLSFKQPSDPVNIETDLIGKYVARLLGPLAGRGGIDRNFLAEHGFL